LRGRASAVNPDATGRPSPVQVHVFQLNALSGFQEADFFKLTENGASTLGRSLLGTEQFVLKPGQKRAWSQEVPMGTRFLGVVAAYRDLDNASWRAVVEIPPNKTTAVEGVLNAKMLTLKPKPQ
jgi:type VI secretion system protein VasD